MPWKTICVLSLLTAIAVPASAQTSTDPETRSTVCTLTDGKQMTVRYVPVPDNSKKDPPTDKIWSPGNSPMYLFTESDFSVAGKEVPAGAYAMYFIPGNHAWTLVLNKDVTPGSKYDEKQDIVRAPMDMGKLSEPQAFTLAFAHMAPKQCDIRIYYGKAGSWVAFQEK
jgi:hypothetical protein